MPVAHIGLTVSHLPTSCSFFIAALQPLGYRFLGQWGSQIGLGVYEADFFLTQETPGMKAGAAHVAFSASSRIAVREFYANALQAGGKPHGSPASRTEGDGCFNAAVLDLDGNSVEVVFHESVAADDGGSVAGKSRLLTWRDDVSDKLGDQKSAINLDTISSVASSAMKTALVPTDATSSRSSNAPSDAPSVASTIKTTGTTPLQGPVIRRSFTAPASTLTPQSSNDDIRISRKTLVGTILVSAAAASLAYAMCKSEEDSAKAEQAAYMAAKRATKHLQANHPHLLEAKPSYSPVKYSALNASEYDHVRGYDSLRAIEAASPSVHQQSMYQQPPYQPPSCTTVITGPPQINAITPPRSRVSSSHSQQSTPDRRSQGSTTPGYAIEEQSRDKVIGIQADSGLEERKSSHSKSTHSKAKSIASASKHSSNRPSKRSPRSKTERSRSRSTSRPTAVRSALRSIHESQEDERTPSKPSSRASKARTSVLGRSINAEDMRELPPSLEEKDIDLFDHDTVVPEDSVSQIGSSSRRRSSHRRHSSPAQHSQHSSYHTSAFRRASENPQSAPQALALGIEQKQSYATSPSTSGSRSSSKQRRKKSHRSSETGTESTITPGNYAEYAREYLAEHDLPVGAGSISSMPIRGAMRDFHSQPSSYHHQPGVGVGDGRDMYCEAYADTHTHPRIPGRSVASYYG